jgi:hypothetical protein
MESLDSFRRDVLEGKLGSRVALECVLLVRLGVRPAAIVTLPAELPGGDVLGAQVDYEFKSRIGGGGRDMKTRLTDTLERRKLAPLAFKTYVLRSSFVNIVMKSDEYNEHRRAAKSLGLELQESEVRPTIREWYISLPEQRLDVADILHRRRALQKERRGNWKPGEPLAYYIYPEEQAPEHLRNLGRLLGYPECCVEGYLANRLAGTGDTSGTPEERAARQIAGAAGPQAFWLKDFFPCRPDCPRAMAKGQAAREALALVDPAFGDLYDRFRGENLARVRSGPEAVRQHEEWLLRKQDQGRPT